MRICMWKKSVVFWYAFLLFGCLLLDKRYLNTKLGCDSKNARNYVEYLGLYSVRKYDDFRDFMLIA